MAVLPFHLEAFWIEDPKRGSGSALAGADERGDDPDTLGRGYGTTSELSLERDLT